MLKFKNGWTKKKMIKHIELNFKGKAIENTQCLYKTSDGKKCAVGLFIPENHVGQKYIGSVSGLLKIYPDLKKSMPTTTGKLKELQFIHDLGNSYFKTDDKRTDEEVLCDLISFIESET